MANSINWGTINFSSWWGQGATLTNWGNTYADKNNCKKTLKKGLKLMAVLLNL